MTTTALQLFLITLLSIFSFNSAEAQENATPDYLYKIVSKDAWKESLQRNELSLSPMDEKFIHLAKEEQVPHVAEKFWSGIEHVILKIESKNLTGRLCYETNPGGSTKYFHLYDGSIPLNAVVEQTFVSETINEKTGLATADNSPFNYDLHLFSIPGKSARTMVLFHGYGSNYKIAETLEKLECIDATLVSFNFPDPNQAVFGTINEILPALYVLKKHVVDEGRELIDLYGFSAGGGAVVNLIAILNTSRFDAELKQIGIADKEKKQLLNAIQKGIVILDVPLKSVEEIIDFRGSSTELEILAKNYRNNHLRPIDSLELLQGLTLNVILHFQEADEILYNRDDAIYIERLKKANERGTTSVIIGNDGGHLEPHWSLWRFYDQKMQ